MATVRKTITLTQQQDAWISAQIADGHYTNDSEVIRDLIRREQERSFEIETIRLALIEGEQSADPAGFDFAAFKQRKSAQLADTDDLAREILQIASRGDGSKAPSRVREMLEIINLVQSLAGGAAQAVAWYRAEPIAAFDGRTAEALVESGNASAVRAYVDHLATGGQV